MLRSNAETVWAILSLSLERIWMYRSGIHAVVSALLRWSFGSCEGETATYEPSKVGSWRWTYLKSRNRNQSCSLDVTSRVRDMTAHGSNSQVTYGWRGSTIITVWSLRWEVDYKVSVQRTCTHAWATEIPGTRRHTIEDKWCKWFSPHTEFWFVSCCF